MKEREFTAIHEQDGEWTFASAPGLPGAFGHGRPIDEAREDLKAAILPIIEELGESAEQAAGSALFHGRITVAVA